MGTVFLIILFVSIFVGAFALYLFKEQSKVVSEMKVGDKVFYEGFEGEVVSINPETSRAEVKFSDFPMMRLSKK